MPDPKSPPPTPPLATWQKALLGSAAAIGVVGAGLVVYAASGGDAGTATEQAENLRSGLVSDSVAAGAGDTTRDAARLWGDHLWRGALAFVLAFCVGTAVRKSVRVGVVVVGFAVIVFVGLHLAGLYEVDWTGVGEQAADAVDRAREQTGDLLESASAYLGSVIAGAAGLVIGFVRA